MNHLPDRTDGVRGFVAGLNGIALCFIASVATAYQADELPWQSLHQFIETVRIVLDADPVATEARLIQYAMFLGIGIAIIGPFWFWVASPLLRERS